MRGFCRAWTEVQLRLARLLCDDPGVEAADEKEPAGSAEQLVLDLPGLVQRSFQPSAAPRFGMARRSPAAVSVADFHRWFGLPYRSLPGLDGVPTGLLNLRVSLLQEEVEEFAEAAEERDLVAMADALADVVYVAYGAAMTLGVDLDDVLAEVHRSNLTKLGPDGRPLLRQDGKVLKPPGYEAPRVAAVIDAQPPMPVRGRAAPRVDAGPVTPEASAGGGHDDL